VYIKSKPPSFQSLTLSLYQLNDNKKRIDVCAIYDIILLIIIIIIIAVVVVPPFPFLGVFRFGGSGFEKVEKKHVEK
jgi:hypothetical protein